MTALWIQSVHNLHCPTCDTRLVERGRRCALQHRARSVYVGEVGTLTCAYRHPLPDRVALYDYREEQGHPPVAPVAEVPAPQPAAALLQREAGPC